MTKSESHNTPAASLRRSFAAICSGQLVYWEPLPLAATRSDLETVMGAPVTPASTLLFGQPAQRIAFPSSAVLPAGATLWLQHNQLVLVDVRAPVVPTGALDALGPAELELESGLGDAYVQWLYPERGLILHVSRNAHQVKRLLGIEATALDTLRRAPIVSLHETRVPLN